MININQNISIKKEGESKMILKENTNVNEDVNVKYIFEVNTINNIKNVTLTDYTASKGTYSAYYDLDLKDWGGSSKEVNMILSTLIECKITVESLGNGMTEVYTNGKTQFFKD